MKKPYVICIVLFIIAAIIGVTLYLRNLPGQSQGHRQVGDKAATLQATFNDDVAKTRVLALVAPTCGYCLRGATTLQNDVFAKFNTDQLRGYIVWVPEYGGQESNVAQATRTIPDPRATHYWDNANYLSLTYPSVLGIRPKSPAQPASAWDSYLVYPPGVRWDGPTPPKPSYWIQQINNDRSSTDFNLGGPVQQLDGPTIARHVQDALNQSTHERKD